jgi:hypothetical protein
MPDSPGERIRAALEGAQAHPAFARAGRPSAVGWATVELDRAARELAADLGLTPDAFSAARDSLVLGARCRVAADATAGGLALAILEPATEGRLAAFLARYGEGPAAIWFAADDAAATDGPGPSPGPFGPERAASQGPGDGPRWFLIDAGTGTIPA